MNNISYYFDLFEWKHQCRVQNVYLNWLWSYFPEIIARDGTVLKLHKRA